MALYCYIKSESKPISRSLKDKIEVRKILKIASPFFVLLGIVLIGLTVFPMVNYKLIVYKHNKNELASPVSDFQIAEAKGKIKAAPISPQVAGVNTKNVQTIKAQEIDYHQLNNWFPAAPVPEVNNSKITHYTLSIPKLNIEDAIVEVGGQEIKNTLIHYPGTALPGEYGNSVIFGHSVLPVFYNPKDYKAIFSTIPTLDKGDKIYLNYDGMEFIYEVEKYFEVKPEQVSVLQQKFNEQVLSLITCVPPGTYIKRGVIKGRLMR